MGKSRKWNRYIRLLIEKRLVCQNCGGAQVIQRKADSDRKDGHVKDIYCPVCMRTTKHTETRT